MAPTEVLAEQHYLGVRELLADLVVPDAERLGGARPLAVALLTNRTPAAERAKLHQGLRSGSVDLVVGTHALLTDEVRFSSLGVVVIDEQHRFGVEQRDTLRAKGRDASDGEGADPDLLVMTATPIPRTAAMVFFGDLDVTELDELPAGRSPVRTEWARTDERREGAPGRGCATRWRRGTASTWCAPWSRGPSASRPSPPPRSAPGSRPTVLAGLRIGLLHGQLKASEKEGVMEGFRRGDIEVLVATTVIEVGVDVPEATVMVVEDADRFGIAQLHQLRGRVGRSDRPSWCYLFSGASTPEARDAPRGPRAAATTASSWPRSTSSCGARARSSARARRAAAT